jgi:hypothetical protein
MKQMAIIAFTVLFMLQLYTIYCAIYAERKQKPSPSHDDEGLALTKVLFTRNSKL